MIAATMGILLGVIIMVAVGTAAFKAQRKFGSKGLIFVWLASAGIFTVIFTAIDFTIFHYYSPTPLDLRLVLLTGASQLLRWRLFAGVVVWHVGAFGPRPPSATLYGRPDDLLTVPRVRWRMRVG
jgi:hypothetical protein